MAAMLVAQAVIKETAEYSVLWADMKGIGEGEKNPGYPIMPLVNLYFSNSDSTWRNYCEISHYFIFMIDNGRGDYICL